MLKFEFIQPGEFDDPWYKFWCGVIAYDGHEWGYYQTAAYVGSNELDQISAKLKQLNGVK